MATVQQIGRAGEAAVVADLRRRGWRVVRWDTQGPGATDVEAVGGGRTILVQVKAAVWPSPVASMSPDDRASIRLRALFDGARAYEAAVTLWPYDLSPTDIRYTRLN